MKASFASLTWERYCLITPLLLTAGQRESLEAVWSAHDLAADIRDIDWIEKLLYRHAEVRLRFFPEFQLLFPPEHATIDIGFPECSEMCELYLFVKRFQQGIRLRVPAELTVGGLVELLIDKLDLPRQASVRFLGHQSFNAVWALHRSDIDLALDSQQTFKSLGLPPGTTVELVGTFEAGLSISYMGGGGRHKHVAVNDKSQGWIARRITDESEIEESISAVIGRRLGALFPGRAAPASTESSLSDVIRTEEDEDRRLPPKHLVLKISALQFTFLAHALIEFGSGFCIDDFQSDSVRIDKEKMGDVMEAYGAFHRVLEAKRGSLAENFNDIDDVCDQSRHLKTELLNHYLWIGPGPGSVTFSRR